MAAAIAAGAALAASPALAQKGGPRNAAQDADIDALHTDIGFLLLQHARLVFVTEGGFTGNLIAEAATLGLGDFTGEGLLAGDAICQDEAEAAGLVGDFTAWLSDNTDDAKDRVTDTGLPYILFDTTLISDDLAGLIDGAIDNPIDLDAFAGLTATAVWTGTATDGMGTVTHCGNWTDDTGGLSGTIGSSTRSTANWTINGSASCNASAFHLYCFQR